MSEKSKQIKSVEKSKVESKERPSKEKERTLRKQPMEDVKKMAEKLGETETSPSIKATSKVSTADKPEDPEATETPIWIAFEGSASVEPETPKVPEVRQMRKTTETSTSTEPEAAEMEASKVIPEVIHISVTSTPDKPEDTKVPEMCRIPKIISELPVFKFKFSDEVPEEFRTSEIMLEVETLDIPELLETPETTSEMPATVELEAPKVPEVNETSTVTSNIAISDESKDRKVPKSFRQVPEATSETSTTTSTIPEFEMPELRPEIAELGRLLETVHEISVSLLELETSEFQKPKITSETFAELESPQMLEVAELIQMSTTASQTSASDKSEDCQVLEECQMSQTTASISGKTKDSEAPELRQTCSMSKITVETEEPKSVPEILRTYNIAQQMFIPVKCDDLDGEACQEACQMHHSTSKTSTLTKSEGETNPTKDIKDDNPEIPTKKLKENSSEETKSFDSANKKISSIFEQNTKSIRKLIKRKIWPPISMPNFKEPHLVLATHHLVPSLPIGLFEVFAEMIEVVTKRPVVLLHECRDNRPIATEIVDIVVMPAAECWQNGVLLPASFVFEHHLNKNKSPGVYADVIVANNRALYIKDIMDLRGHKCAIPNKRSQFTAAGLLFNHLHSKGENLIFFSNIFDAKTQLEALEMVINKQAEVGVLESPVIRCHKYGPLDVNSLHILTSIGPMPPYRIMVNETLAKKLNEELATYLLNINKYEEWLERLLPFGVIGFAKNSMDYYKPNEIGKKHVASVPYY